MTDIQKKLKKARALLDTGKHQRAYDLFQEILSSDPTQPEACSYTGLAHMQAGMPEQALHYFETSLSRNPDQPDVYYMMGVVYGDMKNTGKATLNFLNAWQLQPETPHYAISFINSVATLRFNEPDPVLLTQITTMIAHPAVSTDWIFGTWLSLFRFTQCYEDLIKISHADSDKTLLRSLENKDLISALFNLKMQNPELENALTAIRKSILLQKEYSAPLIFLAALGIQNFQNEYVWNVSTEEEFAIKLLLEKATKKTLTLPEYFILAAYQPLHTVHMIENCSFLAEQDASGFAQNVWQQQVAEPMAEADIQKNIPTLTKINDTVSQEVQAQYEANPYPRWKTLASPPIITLRKYLQVKFPYYDPQLFNSIPVPCKVLIAGSGTGRQVLECVKTFQGYEVTAVDLSRASLSYAIRKQKELIPNGKVSFSQADILRLEECFNAESFDVVESTGVLHHMADPLQGWQVITHLLKKGGFMKIALYSQHARAVVNVMRQKIAAEKISSTPQGIRSLREYIKAHTDEPELKKLIEVPDFYSLSECRDLLFHVQEHQFTIPQIADALKALGLKFIGFDSLDKYLMEKFTQRFPDRTGPGSFEEWDQYEKENPQTFGGMYQFWVQKI